MNLQIQVLTLTQTLFKGEASLVIAPGEEGDFGVLPSHAPLISHLKKGTISIHQGETVKKTIDIEKGWANIANNQCIFLVE